MVDDWTFDGSWPYEPHWYWGVTRAEVSFEKRQATVTFDDAKNVEALTRATTNAGYPSTLVQASK
jgi:mercuric ion binding protein